jgi:hypothetical protein
VTRPAGLYTGQFTGSSELDYWILKPIGSTTGWLVSPLDYIRVGVVDPNNYSNILNISNLPFTKAYENTPNNVYSASTFAFGAQLIQPLGSTATTALTVQVQEMAYNFNNATKTITLNPEYFGWSANVSSIASIKNTDSKILLSTYLSLQGVTFSGPGTAVSGGYLDPSQIQSGTIYKVTAAKAYDNGTYQVSININVN